MRDKMNRLLLISFTILLSFSPLVLSEDLETESDVETKAGFFFRLDGQIAKPRNLNQLVGTVSSLSGDPWPGEPDVLSTQETFLDFDSEFAPSLTLGWEFEKRGRIFIRGWAVDSNADTGGFSSIEDDATDFIYRLASAPPRPST
jgi:hypothetical protein